MPVYRLDSTTPEIAEDAWVAPTATVIGNIAMAQASSVWFGAVLRGDNELISVGARSNVQDLCVLHTDQGFPLTIGEDCTIGHSAILHGCTIGPGSLVGMGATVLNGAIIGRNCIIGANALVPEGKEIADNSLVVGAPGKVIRSLDDATAKFLLASAAHYAANAQRFRSGLVAVWTDESRSAARANRLSGQGGCGDGDRPTGPSLLLWQFRLPERIQYIATLARRSAMPVQRPVCCVDWRFRKR